MAQAIHRHLRMTPLKVRRVARLVMGKPVAEADRILQLDSHMAAPELRKVIKSAAANAVNNEHLNEDLLVVQTVMVDKGRTLRRMLPRSRGRADVVRKRMCHITVLVTEGQPARRAG